MIVTKLMSCNLSYFLNNFISHHDPSITATSAGHKFTTSVWLFSENIERKNMILNQRLEIFKYLQLMLHFSDKTKVDKIITLRIENTTFYMTYKALKLSKSQNAFVFFNSLKP
jgi:hypothetical protein